MSSAYVICLLLARVLPHTNTSFCAFYFFFLAIKRGLIYCSVSLGNRRCAKTRGKSIKPHGQMPMRVLITTSYKNINYTARRDTINNRYEMVRVRKVSRYRIGHARDLFRIFAPPPLENIIKTRKKKAHGNPRRIRFGVAGVPGRAKNHPRSFQRYDVNDSFTNRKKTNQKPLK